MTKLIEDLLELQSLLRLGDTATAEQKTKIEALRADIPVPILAHFLRQLATGRRGVALVRNGVCGECHLRVAHSSVHLLRTSNDLILCENCGAYITLAPEDATASAPSPILPRRRVAKKVATPVAA